MVEPSENEHGEKDEEEKKDVFGKFFIVFLCMLYIILSTDVLFKLINYILEKSNEVIDASSEDLLTNGFNYIKNFDYNAIFYINDFYNAFFYTLVLAIILLMFYLTIIFIPGKNFKLVKIALIITMIVFFFIFCIFYKIDTEFEKNKFFIAILAVLLIILMNSIEKTLNKDVKFNISNIFLNIRYLIKNNLNKISKWMLKYRVRLLIFGFSFLSYSVACLLFKGPLSRVFNLPIIIILISGGFFIYGVAIEQIVILSREIVTSMIKQEKSHKLIKKIEELIKNLRSYIDPLLIDFLTAISSYLFITALFKIFSSEKLPSFMNTLNTNLSLILLIPLYVFFYKGGSEIIKSISEVIYDKIENALSVSKSKKRMDSFIKVFDRLAKIGIASLIILNILNRSTGSQGLLPSSPNTEYYEYIIKIAIAAPIVMWVLVLVLDPFFERETIEVGTNTGKIRNVGFFFTKLETLAGEHVYIPNAELLARTIKRLNTRGSKKVDSNPEKDKTQDQKVDSNPEKDKTKNEKGIIINFQCTLGYGHDLHVIRTIFDEMFKKSHKKENEKENYIDNLKKYLDKAGFDLKKKEIKRILSEPCQFVSIEEFKDHGIVYGFNFRVKDSFYAPIFRSYFMSKFKEKMETEIITPLKIEIRTLDKDDFT